MHELVNVLHVHEAHYYIYCLMLTFCSEYHAYNTASTVPDLRTWFENVKECCHSLRVVFSIEICYCIRSIIVRLKVSIVTRQPITWMRHAMPGLLPGVSHTYNWRKHRRLRRYLRNRANVTCRGKYSNYFTRCWVKKYILRPTHGGKAAVRHHFNVTATGFDRGNSAAAVELLLAVEIKKSTAAVANVT